MNSIIPAISKWYIIYTHHNCERKIQARLKEKNIRSFLPLKKTLRTWSDRKKIVEIALFPNYLFVYTTIKDKFKILEVKGVSRFITFNGVPTTISNKELSIINKMLYQPGVSIEEFLEGDSVEITEGPFSGLTGIIFEKKGKKRFGIKLKSINQSLSAEFEISSIKKNKDPIPCRASRNKSLHAM